MFANCVLIYKFCIAVLKNTIPFFRNHLDKFGFRFYTTLEKLT